MSANYINIKEVLLQKENLPLLDVRTAAEFEQAHIPGALSFPIFSNEERAIIGTAYKKQSREVAVKMGLDFFGPRMSSVVSAAEKICEGKEKKIMVHCWRGGMRSGAMSWLLDFYGFEVQVLTGGYKSYRQLALEQFKQPYDFKILGGYTGTGKTVLLKKMQEKNVPLIDLEDLAKHKGSAFGSMAVPQPSQEMFENLLAEQLIKNENKTCWLEDESQRIGDVKIPDTIWKTMRAAPVYFVDLPFDVRLRHIMKDYGSMKPENIIAATERITKRLGPQHARQAIIFVKEGDIKACFDILLKYYDVQYGRGLEKRADDVVLNKFVFDAFDEEHIVKQLI